MKFVIDSNIVFSAIYKNTSNIANLLFYSENVFKFYSIENLKDEIISNKNKLLSLTSYEEEDLNKLIKLSFLNIHFIDVHAIPSKIINYVFDLCFDIDINDYLFIALAEYLEMKLWTGDKQLISGLSRKGYSNIITTAEILSLNNEIANNT